MLKIDGEVVNNSPEILYVCDRRQCGEVCPNLDCNHTTDINHAANFKIYRDIGTYFVEGGWPKETEV